MDIAPNQHQQGGGPESHDNVLASETAEVEQGRRYREHHPGQQRPKAAQVVAKEVGQPHEGGAKKHIAQTGSKIGISEEPEDEGGEFNLEWTMHPGGVDVLF